MPAYDATRFQPTAPLANVILRNQDTGMTWFDVPMLLDTGADLTLVPRAVLERLGLLPDPSRQYELVGFDGGTSFAQIVQLELIFLGKRFRGPYLLIEQEYGILGRNILNSVRLVLDGPMQTWEELKRK
jgi:hypothetical protein